MFPLFQIYLFLILKFRNTRSEDIVSDNNTVSWNILPQFPNYMLIIHYDNDSYHDLDVFFMRSSLEDVRIKNLYNYDIVRTIRRPLGYKFLNLVFLRSWGEFRRFSTVEKNIKYEDVVIFVSRSFVPNLDNYFYYKGLEQASAIFVYSTKEDAIYTAKFYNANSGVLSRVVVDENGIPKLAAYLNDFRDFDHFKMKVAFSNCEPYIYKSYEDDEDRDNYVVKGAEFIVFNIIAEMLNFDVILIDYSNRTLPRTSMIQAVRDKIVHIAIGCISNTISRNKIVHFTSDIKIEEHITIFSSSGYEDNSFFKIFKPFQTEVWIYLIVTIILMGLLIKKMTDYIIGFQEVDLVDYVKIPFRHIIEQPIELPTNKVALRMICTSWFLFAMIITNSYKSKLASSLIKPEMDEPEDLYELVVNKFSFLIPSNDPSFLQETLSNSNDKTFKTVLKRWRTGLPICEAICKSLTGRFAVIDEKTSIKYKFWKECFKMMTPAQASTVRLTKRSIFPNSHVWALQKSAPFSKRFTMALEVLQSTGIVYKWYNSFNLTRSIPYSNQDLGYDEKLPLDMETVFAPFIMLIGGIIISSIAFIVELAYFKYRYNGIDYIK